ncbi:tRNA glutamyl-Q(34) synthetase GluQRS [Xanthobacter sp. V4C-4]|uniref:tRNA glutamyl-Q(34) synthetase GluQRS n=1 Tax=Xanthobacter cornucopiae TaxID=3119924 RepID=UPI0037289085
MTRPPGPFVCRFAPSPNGRLHLGHAYSAMVNEAAARAAGGTFLLRIEDIDATRCRADYEAGILEDLAWLSIIPDAPPRRQSEHFADYAAALAALEARGLVYPAFESRSDILRAVTAREAATGAPHPRDPDGAPLFPIPRAAVSETARAARRAAGEPFVLRLDMARALTTLPAPLTWLEAQDAPDGPTVPVPADPAAWGDVILARREVPTSYHLSVVVDDAAQGISHVIRGQDLFHATAVHRLLQHLLGLPSPVYHHHRLILDESGRKLSKSHDATSLAALRAAGVTAREIRARLAPPVLARPGIGQPTPST